MKKQKRGPRESESTKPDGIVEPKEWVAPRTPAEELIAEIYASGLEISRIGVHDDLAALGVDSQLAAQVRLYLQQIFQVDIPTEQLLIHTTIDSLINLLSELWGGREIVDEIAWMFLQVEQLSDDEVQSQLTRISTSDAPEENQP